MPTPTAFAGGPGAAAFVTKDQELQTIRRYVTAPRLRIIEAGCGRRWPRQLTNPTAKLIGVDVDTAALAMRTDLTETHVGDVCDIALPGGEADVVYSAYVLEHVQGAKRALENFVAWLKPGGVLILRIPDRHSVWGFVTRTTPHWFHVLFKRYVDSDRGAGKPGFGPYPTFHEAIVSRDGIRAFCRTHDCEILHELESCHYLDSPEARALKTRGLKKAVAMSMSALSLGRLSWRHDNLCLIIRKRTAAAAVPLS